MARGISPETNGGANLGSSAKNWGKVFTQALSENADVGNNASLGFRQPSTSYSVGAIAYHSALPTGWYLECTTAGTTGSGDLTISSPVVNATVNDGTVVWKECKNDNSFYKNTPLISDADNYITPGIYAYSSSSFQVSNIPSVSGPNNDNGRLLVFNAAGSGNGDTIQLMFFRAGSFWYRVRTWSFVTANWAWTTWQQFEAIVAQSLGTNGYVKYASGLIVQWYTSDGSQPITISTKVWEGKDSANRTFIIGY
jgi:hypothetical protein